MSNGDPNARPPIIITIPTGIPRRAGPRPRGPTQSDFPGRGPLAFQPQGFPLPIPTPQPFPVEPPPATGAAATRAILGRVVAGGVIGAIIVEGARRILKRARELDEAEREREREAELEIILRREAELRRERIVRTEKARETAYELGKIELPAPPEILDFPTQTEGQRVRIDRDPVIIDQADLPKVKTTPYVIAVDDPREDDEPSSEPQPQPKPEIPAPAPLPAPAPATKPAPSPATRPAPRPTPAPLRWPIFLPLPAPSVRPRLQPLLDPTMRPRRPPVTTLDPTGLTTPQRRGVPFPGGPPASADNCQQVKRRRRRKGKCREGFFEELPGSTKYVTWRTVDCITREETKASKEKRKIAEKAERAKRRIQSTIGA